MESPTHSSPLGKVPLPALTGLESPQKSPSQKQEMPRNLLPALSPSKDGARIHQLPGRDADITALLNIDLSDPHKKLGTLAPLDREAALNELHEKPSDPPEHPKKHKHKHKHKHKSKEADNDHSTATDAGDTTLRSDASGPSPSSDSEPPKEDGGHKHKHKKHHRKHKNKKSEEEELQEKRVKAAVRIQKIARGVLSRLKVRRTMFQKAKKAGVMLAMPGTKQGKTGWYQANEHSYPIYCEVDAKGQWKVVKNKAYPKPLYLRKEALAHAPKSAK